MSAKMHSPTTHDEKFVVLEHRMDTVERTLGTHGSKLDAIITAVSGHSSFDPLRVLQFIAFAVGIVAAAGTAITYIATSVAFVPTAENSQRISKVEFMADEIWKAGRWTPNVTTAVKGNVQTQ